MVWDKEKDPYNLERLRQREGTKTNKAGQHVVYKDTQGHLTVGRGHKLTAAEKKNYKAGDVWKGKDIEKMFEEDAGKARFQAAKMARRAGIKDPAAINSLRDMYFQMGSGWEQKFPSAVKALESGDYNKFTRELQVGSDGKTPSLWAQQTPKRVNDVVETFTNLYGNKGGNQVPANKNRDNFEWLLESGPLSTKNRISKNVLQRVADRASVGDIPKNKEKQSRVYDNSSEDIFVEEAMQPFTGAHLPRDRRPEVVYDDAFAEEELAKVGVSPKKQTGGDRLDALFPTTTPTPTPAPVPVPADIDPEDAAADEIEQWAPKDLYLDPVYHDLNTAEPATEEEMGLFDSKAFKDSALVFGLSMLMGNSVQDSLGYAGSAYVREDYKNTEEFKEMQEMGVPDSVILNALETDDWSETRAWINQIEAVKKEEQARKNPGLSEGQKSTLDFVEGLAKDSYTKAAVYESGLVTGKMYLEALDKGVLNSADEIGVVNFTQGMFDPNATVKEGDAKYIDSKLNLGTHLSEIYKKVVIDKDRAFMSANPSKVRELVEAAQRRAQFGLAAENSKLAGFDRSAANAGIPANYWSWSARVRDPRTVQNHMNEMAQWVNR